MSPENQQTDAVELNLKETELTLGLPGAKTAQKRGFSETVDLNLGTTQAASEKSDSNKSPAPK